VERKHQMGIFSGWAGMVGKWLFVIIVAAAFIALFVGMGRQIKRENAVAAERSRLDNADDGTGTGLASFFAAADAELAIGPAGSTSVVKRIETAVDDATHMAQLPAGEYWVAFRGTCPKPEFAVECVLRSFPQDFTVVANQRAPQVVISYVEQGYRLRTPSDSADTCGDGPGARACEEGEFCVSVRQGPPECLRDCTETGACPDGQQCLESASSGPRFCVSKDKGEG
jgi:hypothetical protein